MVSQDAKQGPPNVMPNEFLARRRPWEPEANPTSGTERMRLTESGLHKARLMRSSPARFSHTIRTAHSRTSGEYLPLSSMTFSSQEIGSREARGGSCFPEPRRRSFVDTSPQTQEIMGR